MIEQADDIPDIDDVGDLQKKMEQIKQLREGGEGWYDACLRVADNDAQEFVLTQLMLREVRRERKNS